MSSSEMLRARSVEITKSELIVELEDGTRHSAPIAMFPLLAEATPEERKQWQFTSGGAGIHWPALDEDISVFSIVHPEQTRGMRASALEPLLRANRERRTAS